MGPATVIAEKLIIIRVYYLVIIDQWGSDGFGIVIKSCLRFDACAVYLPTPKRGILSAATTVFLTQTHVQLGKRDFAMSQGLFSHVAKYA